MSGPARRGTGGRPTAKAAAQLEASILERATAAFLADGYAATSIEAIATACGVAKRTIYARWDGKPALFRAALTGLLGRWITQAGDFAEQPNLEAELRDAAHRMLAVALTPEAIALHRLLVAESGRFPELPDLIRQAGGTLGQERIAAILHRAVGRGALPPQNVAYAAEQFMHLVLAGPQHRALGLRPASYPAQAAPEGVQGPDQSAAAWAGRAVALFLQGATR